MEKYLLSIIIPTRNRQFYLIKTLEQILSLINNKVEVIVQDNSDDNSLKNNLIFSNLNIKYFYDSKRLSFVDNFSRAISNASGKYLIIIGDDDGILPNLLHYLEFANNNNIDVLVPRISIEYFYPNSVKIKNKSNGTLRFIETTGKISRVKGKNEIVKLLKYGSIDYTQLKLAKLYHGLVKKSILDKINFISGNYVGGLTPDIYLAVSLSLLSDSLYYIDLPLTIAGVCPQSGSAYSSNKLHVGKYEDAPHLFGRVNYKWSNLIPKFYSVETIWADSALAAIKDIYFSNYINYFSTFFLHLFLFLKYKAFRKIIFNSFKFNTKNISALQFSYIFLISLSQYFSYYFFKIFLKIKRLKNRKVFLNGIDDIKDATMLYLRYLERKK